MRFEKPVRVAAGPAGKVTTVVGDAERAARVLLDEWPGTPGAKHRAARRAVLAAMESVNDRVKAERARKAFEAAAIEAGMIMPEQPKSGARDGFVTSDWSRRMRKR